MRLQHLTGLLIAVCLLLYCPHSSAYYYKQYTTSNTLISNNVYHSLRDSKGYMWFFTDKGVSKFDGAVFKNFTASDGITDYDVFAGYEDKLGRLWLYTYNGNPCFIKNDKVYNAGNNVWLSKLPVIPYMESICENTDSSLYIGYINGQVIKADKRGYEWILNAPNEFDQLFSMSKAGDTLQVNRTYVALSLLGNKIVGTEKTARALTFHDYNELLRIDYEGVKIYNGHTLTWQHNDSNLAFYSVLHVYHDRSNNVFYSTSNGLVIINAATGHKDVLLENIKVSSVNQDLLGNYWITTMGNGIFYLNRNLNLVRPVKAVDNYKTYATNNGQLFFIKSPNAYYLNKDSLMPVRVPAHNYSVPLYINDHQFFFADSVYAYSMNRQSKQVTRVSFALKNVYQTDSNRFLLIGAKCISTIILQKGKAIPADTVLLGHIGQSCFSNNTLYCSRDNIIYRYDVATKTRTTIDSLSPYQSVNSLYLEGNLLVITTNGENIIYYSMRSGVPQKTVKRYPFACYEIIRMNTSGHRYILNTSKGYYIVDSLENISGSMQLLESPVSGTDILSLYVSGSKAICRMTDGYYLFDCALVNKEKKNPAFFIDRVLINDRLYLSRKVHIKGSGPTHVSMDLSQLKFDQPAGKYEYRIIRADTSRWFITSNNKLDIFLEKFGDYIIEVRALTENRITSGPQYLALTISPPFYRSFPFYAFAALALLLAGVLVLRGYNKRKLKAFQNELNYLQLEHKAINSLLNPHFIFNAINNIQNLVNISSKENANNYLVVLSRLIRQNMENLQFSFIPVSRELNLIRNYITLQNLRFDNRITLNIEDNCGDTDRIQIPPLLIHTFVENSVVHGFRKELDNFTINVELNLSLDDYLIIRITDNGAGLQQKSDPITSGKLSLGIDFIRKRLSRLSEFYKVTFTLDIRDLQNAQSTGTEVLVILYSKFRNEEE